MLKSTVYLSFFFLTTLFYTNSNCDSAYSSSSYALNYAKKALKADNFDHQKYYAEKSLIALEKTKKQMKECDCKDAVNAVLNGITNLEKAATPKDWDLGRHYSKLALKNVENTITALDAFTLNSSASATNEDISTNQQLLISEASELEKKRIRLDEELKILQEKRRLLAIKITENIQKQSQN
ncbi:hypothetical protein MWU65_14615 [Cellulophaga sp. F20128]|uniref:hypothetical protein n=1 Tax=Cellulophaga sp. F20128 TaxID=2926413 RepID=UPI001FF43880|nr:hypothetical protein [Cellulophaga sp. F20128]MCK0158425.1 hypothetical protein [Cellulophaga sp. F20128]